MHKGAVIFLLLAFSLYTIFTMAIADESLLAFGYRMMSSWDTAQVIIDLYVMALLAIVWMYKDCKSRNKSLYYWMTFTFLTLVFVSIGPLLYLSLRPSEQQGKVKA